VDVEIEEAVRDAVVEAARLSTEFDSERLEELGWGELLEADAESAVRSFLDEQGRLVLSSSVLDSVIVAALGDERWAWPAAGVIYPIPGRSTCLDDQGAVRGIAFSGSATEFLVPVEADGELRLFVARRADVSYLPVEAIDPTLGLASVSAAAAQLEDAGIGVEESAAAIAAGRRALAHELIGLSSRMVDIVVSHVTVREQFGRPLGANQAVQHKLADAKVLLEAATVIADEAWETPTPFAALVAKAQASRAFDLIAASGQQLLGAMGYTWEHEWRKYVRRGFLLTVLLGAADELEHEIGATLVADGVPRVGLLFGSDSP
jgi:hypothetical protein